MSKLYDVLEVCLQEIENGASVEAVLLGYPEFAEELRPILETAVKAKSIAASAPAPDVIRRNRAKVLQRAAQLRAAKAQPSHSIWSVFLRRSLVSLAVVATLFIGGTSLVRASSTTLPGDNLYPVKRTWEDVQVLLTFDVNAREALEVKHENERLEELTELFARRRSVRVDFVGLVTRQNGDLWRVAGIPVVLPAQADVRGSVAVGDAVRVRGLTQVDGSVLAERVELLGTGVPLPDVEDDLPDHAQENSDDENENGDSNSGAGSGNESSESSDGTSQPEEISLEGTVDSINGNILIVDGQTMDVTNAEIKGEPAVGRRVKAEGYYDVNGVFIVTKIEFFQSNSGSDDNDSDSNDNSDDENGNDNGNSNDNDDDDHGGGNTNDNDNDDNSGPGGGGDD